MAQFLASQFGNPRGVLGGLIGWAMAAKNRERTEWTVSLLEVQPRDHVLEIGFGPGVGVELVSTAAGDGLVAGIDHSEVMVEQARRRVAAAIRSGRVDLRPGSVASIPFPDNGFDKAFAINSLRFWPSPVENLKELRRVLKPGGLIAITEQPMGTDGEAQVPRLREALGTQLSAAGFRQIRLESRRMKPAASVCALGVK